MTKKVITKFCGVNWNFQKMGEGILGNRGDYASLP